MLRKRGQKGFTLIELLIVIAIIGILAAIAIPMYRAQTVRAKLSEVTNSMSAVASAMGNFRQDEAAWPGAMANVGEIQTSLGVSIPVAKYIAGAAIGAGNGLITFTVGVVGDTNADGKTITLSGTVLAANQAVDWTWGGTIVPAFLPKK